MSHIDRLENLALQLGIQVGGEGALPPSVTVYDNFFEAHVAPFLAACQTLENKSIVKIGVSCEAVFREQRKFVYAATACAKPSDADLMTFIKPIADAIQAADRLPRRTKVLDHLKAWNEAIQAMNWLCMPNGGVPFIISQRDGAQFHLNRVLSKARDFDDEEKTAAHKAWANAMKNMMTELSEYVKSFHKSGIVWKFGGESILEFSGEEGGTDAKRSDEDRMEDVVTALEAYAARLSGGDGDGPPPMITDWQELMGTELKAFTAACEALDNKKIGDWAVQAWTHCGKVIEATLESKKPADEKWGPFLAPIVEVITGSGNPGRRDADFDMVKGFNECVQVLAWVTMPGAGDYIQSQIDASMLYLNRVLKAAKSAEGEQQAALRNYVATLKALGLKVKEYTNEHHRTGIIWRGDNVELPESFNHF